MLSLLALTLRSRRCSVVGGGQRRPRGRGPRRREGVGAEVHAQVGGGDVGGRGRRHAHCHAQRAQGEVAAASLKWATLDRFCCLILISYVLLD